MTTDPTSPACSAITPVIAPVIDYEPPARAATGCRPQSLTLTPSARHPRGHPPGKWPNRPPRNGLPPPLQSAALFADAALRRVLEVMDGRRPPTHLHPLLVVGLAESVLSVGLAAATSRALPATLQRVRVQPAGSSEPTTAVEAFGTYRRGLRTHALACRIERVAGTRPAIGWRIVALHIG
ncbi:MAG: Rv3235 family protein [Mycobacterium sp.]